jgi:hypothetical protein
MTQYRTIEIDFDVHKRIEAERRSFEETPNDALRRLLNLPERREPASPKPEGRPWSGEGAVLPHGTRVRMTYGQQLIEGEIRDGKWVCDGRSFDTPSAAASALARTKEGSTTSLNGWNYWEAKLPGTADWGPIKMLRRNSLVQQLVANMPRRA